MEKLLIDDGNKYHGAAQAQRAGGKLRSRTWDAMGMDPRERNRTPRLTQDASARGRGRLPISSLEG
ncbi:hypothetical protein [Paenibacillus sp.]|uniref:hypothetical protein n=1 Tax=Paenibacillus sp. TaxID=58172 RepID=UPI002D572B08|nr:hypothetical protein [Paenibacillus sp.]HZG84600.1 hypothetical protein [Paenibacillus sp.]